MVGDMYRSEPRYFVYANFALYAASQALGLFHVTFAVPRIDVLLRANTVSDAGYIFSAIVTKAAPWSLFDGTLTSWGMSLAQWRVLIVSVVVLLCVDVLRGRGVALRTLLERCCRPVRWEIYCAFVTAITVFGVYGPQFDAARFLYF